MSDDKRRFSKVYRRVWNDARFRRLSAAQPNAQTLFLRLLSGPELTNIPGLFSIGESALAEALGWSIEDLRRTFAEVSAQGLARADWRARVVFVSNALRYNVPESPNVVRSWRQAWDELPECGLKTEAYQLFQAFFEGFGEGFRRAFAEACPDPSVRSGVKNGITETYPTFQGFGEGSAGPSAKGSKTDSFAGAESGPRLVDRDEKHQPFQQFQGFGEGLSDPSPNQKQEQEQKQEQKIQDRHLQGECEGVAHDTTSPRAAQPAREVKGTRSARGTAGVGARGTRMTEGWKPGAALLAWASQQGIADPLGPLEEFRDHWLAVPGAKGVKTNWEATYRNRLRYLRDNGRLASMDLVPPPPRPKVAEQKRSPEEQAEIARKLAEITLAVADRFIVR